MTVLDRIQIARAEEQMRSVRMNEPTKHDRWQIRGDDRGARADGKGKHWRPAHCRACAAPATHSTYCKTHWQRVEQGIPVDVDAVPTWTECKRLLAGGPGWRGMRRAAWYAARGI